MMMICYTPSFPVYRAYLKILVFSFYKAQFGCFPSHVQISRCIKSLHARIKRELTNACTLFMHALQLMHWKQNFVKKMGTLIEWFCKLQKLFHHSSSTLVGEIFELTLINRKGGSMLLSTMTSQSRGADTNEGLVVSILWQLTRLHAHQADEARAMLVPCVARTLTKTSRLHLSLRVLNFSISRPRSNMRPMIDPIGWLRTL